ncbi:MAG: hypothetical protein K6G10_13770 [Butyrivibrio sp.]|nr:hypothetical protein [Butyrivibrio sp.]
MTLPDIVKRNKAANLLFYIAIAIETVLMIVEKSELTFSYESYVFRFTFLLTFLAVLIMDHGKKEWIFIALIVVFTAYCYFTSGKNDLLRYGMFILAAKNIDLKKCMKYVFFATLAGFLLIVILSVTGIFGDVSITMDFGRSKVQTRYCLGFGHPNALFASFYALLLMWLWLYGGDAGFIAYAMVTIGMGAIVHITDSRTGMIIVAFTFLMAYLARLFDVLKTHAAIYVLTALDVIVSVGLSVFGAWAAQTIYMGNKYLVNKWYWKVDRKLSGRMSNLHYGAENSGGVLKNWKLFAGHGAESFFDMGWVRLFYWYGIIPTILVIIMILAVVFICAKRKDMWTVVLIASLSVYTLTEATFVTRYTGRNFMIPVFGVYLCSLMAGKEFRKRSS